MAGKNQVTLTFAGDTKNLEKSFDNLDSGAKDMSRGVKEAGDRLDRMGEAADTADTRAMGFRDTMTGVEDTSRGVSEIMKGNLFDGVLMLGMGFGDLASGVANFGVQSLKAAANFVRAGAMQVASMATTAATTVVGWVTMGASALIAGAQMALAWLIGLGPIALVILAIGAIIGILAFLGVGFDDIARIAGIAWNFILDMGKNAFNWLRDNWPLVLAILTGPFGLAVLLIVRNWDTIKEKGAAALRFVGDKATEAKDWVVARFGDVVSFVTGLPGKIKSAASGMFDGIKDAFRSALNWVIGKWNGLSFTLPSATLFGKTIGGGSIDTPNLPTFHTGGTFRSSPGSREGLALLQDGEEINRHGGGSGGVTIIKVYVAGTVRSDKELVKVIEDAMATGRLRPAA